MNWQASLSDVEVAAIRAESREGGGFQQLMGKLQDSIHGNQLTVDGETHKQMVRYAAEYGDGGWQERLREILDKMAPE